MPAKPRQSIQQPEAGPQQESSLASIAPKQEQSIPLVDQSQTESQESEPQAVRVQRRTPPRDRMSPHMLRMLDQIASSRSPYGRPDEPYGDQPFGYIFEGETLSHLRDACFVTEQDEATVIAEAFAIYLDFIARTTRGPLHHRAKQWHAMGRRFRPQPQRPSSMLPLQQ